MTIAALLGVLLLVLTMVLPAMAAETVTAAGTVVNGTAGGSIPAGAEVIVTTSRGTVESIEQRSGPLGPDGRFEVTDLAAGADVAYAARVEHAGVTYWSQPVRPERDGSLPPISLTIYETTAEPAEVTVERHAIAVLRPSAQDRVFDVLELVVLRNESDRAWTPRTDGPGGPMALLRFSLPDGAADLRPGGGLAGEEMFFVDRGFGTTMPLLPGRNEVTFAYRINYGADAYVLTKTFVYPTDQVHVQVPVEIAGSAVGLAEAASQTAMLDGRAYRQFSTADVAPRQTFALHLNSLPGAPPPVLAEPVRWSALGFAVLAAGGAAAYAWRRSARPTSRPVAAEPSA